MIKRIFSIVNKMISDLTRSLFLQNRIGWIVLLTLIFWIGNIDLSRNDSYILRLFIDFATSVMLIALTNSKHKLIRYSGWFFITIASLLSVLNYLLYHYFDLGISVKLFSLLFETNRTESAEYVQQMLPVIFTPMFFLISILLVAASVLMIKLKINVRGWAFIRIVALLVVVSGFCLMIGDVVLKPLGRKNINIVLRSGVDLIRAYRAVASYQQMISQLQPFPDASTLNNKGDVEDVILILGESATRSHFSLYGYPFKTTSDSIFARVINEVKAIKRCSVVIYLSDHGQEVYDKSNRCGHIRMSVEIPFVVWCSDAFIRNHPDKIARLSASMDQPAMTDDFVPFLLDLISIDYKMYSSNRSFINVSYNRKHRVADGEKYRGGGKTHRSASECVAGWYSIHICPRITRMNTDHENSMF